jgi:predicted methyltransferase
MTRTVVSRMLVCLLALAIGLPAAFSQPPAAPAEQRKKRSREDKQKREKSLRAIASHLGVGPGSVIADIGAGDGPDTWVFADIVGKDGKVFAEEIDGAKVTSLKGAAEKRSLSQVEAVLGAPDNPSLPEKAVDMAFMHFVYHHVTQPQEMLQEIWKSLKPEGYLVIVDQRLGTLKDWVPREDRGKKHYWIAETTVVREAREQGYRFVECAESHWHVRDSFVLVFQRPRDMTVPGHDPDPLPPITENAVEQLVLPLGQANQRIAFVALGEGRKLIAPILKSTECKGLDIVLEEWATTKDERPKTPAGVSMQAVLTDQGDPHLGPESLDAVYFLDSYHLLFHGPVLLEKLRERLSSTGRVYILDRQAPEEMPRREASHRRMIAVETVKQEMADAGFRLHREGAPPSPERFLMVFGKAESASTPAKPDSR